MATSQGREEGSRLGRGMFLGSRGKSRNRENLEGYKDKLVAAGVCVWGAPCELEQPGSLG